MRITRGTAGRRMKRDEYERFFRLYENGRVERKRDRTWDEICREAERHARLA